MNLLCDGHALVCPRVFFFLRLEPDVSSLSSWRYTQCPFISFSNLFYFTLVSMADKGVALLLAYFSYTRLYGIIPLIHPIQCYVCRSVYYFPTTLCI